MTVQEHQTDLPTYTKNQLALRNGQDRDEIWVAYQGQIYDVSRSRLWRRGNHYEHWAGQDLTYSPGWVRPMFYWDAILFVLAAIFGVTGIRLRRGSNEFISY